MKLTLTLLYALDGLTAFAIAITTVTNIVKDVILLNMFRIFI